MSHADEKQKQAATAQQQDMVLRIIRLSGLAFVGIGLFLFFNVGGMAEMLGLKPDDEIGKIVGGALMFVGLTDIVVVPLIFQALKKK